ncbi:fungal-specific transcription factor domain-containing protein [Mycena crocata]|nr:fungal-specific transcription factor domain-containing protein [Mycena crocata]
MYSQVLYPPNAKKRRVLRACDICRRRKIRCDSMNMADGRCSSCITLNIECTHTEPARKRGPKKRDVEMQALKSQVTTLKSKLRQVHPSLDASSDQYPASSTGTPPNMSTSYSDASSPDPPPSSEDDAAIDTLTERMNAFSWDFTKNRFFGQSSVYSLARNAISAKEEFTGRPVPKWKRPEYWMTRPWELLVDEKPHYTFPDADLIASLLKLYFSNVHPTLPLLHRPSFERSVKEDLHLRDHQFGALLLAVLALASRYSDDPRVFFPEANSTLSSGWSFFVQVQVISKSWREIPSLYEFQLYCLATLYIYGSSAPQGAFLYLGLGIRFIQDRGEHRRRRGNKPTVEGELWKRAFWCLLTLDMTVCASVGRPSATHVEDYDVDPPLEVDDEYWEHPDPEQAFKQPQGKPSRLTYFVHQIRLCELLDSTIRRLYASDNTKKLMGWVGSEWEQRAVCTLDSAMNEFLESLPNHLRWDPNRTGVFLDQSAMLHITYYQLQITIHRPYITTPTHTPFPSLAICTRAARSGIGIVDVWVKRFRRVPLAPMQMPPFVFSVVLILNVFGAKRAGLPIDVNKELSYVGTAMEALQLWETRYQISGRGWELMNILRSRDDCPRFIQNGAKAPSRFDSLAKPHTVEAVFTGKPVVEEHSSSEPNAHQLSTLPANTMQAPAADIWNGTGMSNLTAGTDMSIEQMLAATSQYDRAGTGSLETQWGGTGEVGGAAEDSNGTGFASANMPMDEEVMSMWMAAPTNFRNLDEWDSYLDMPGFQWSTDFNAQGTDSFV